MAFMALFIEAEAVSAMAILCNPVGWIVGATFITLVGGGLLLTYHLCYKDKNNNVVKIENKKLLNW